jgi:hypothetical protein
MDNDDLLPPDPLPKAPPAIEKVYDLSEAETFKLSGTVAYIEDDTTDTPFSKQAEIEFVNPVPVVRDDLDQTVIGYAMLTFGGFAALGRRLESQVFMSRETPERLDVEAGKLLYPHALFTILEADFLEDGRQLVKKAKLVNIAVSERPADDPAISPLAPVTL